jgi:hypothetical protein
MDTTKKQKNMNNLIIYKNMNANFLYSLEPSGNERKYHICPKCGHKRFVPYINTKTGEYLAENVGRCERENNCGYHYTPKEYFNLNNNNMNKNGKEKLHINEIFEERVEKNSLLCGGEDYPNAAFTFWMIRVFGNDIIPILTEYGVLVAKYFYKEGKYGIAFVQRDKNGVIRQVKLMAYNPHTGKRLKEDDDVLIFNYQTRKYETHLDKPKTIYIGQALMRDYEFENMQCFWGENLLTQYPDKTVAIVESEKTALICAYMIPEYLWIATGGKYGCGWSRPSVYNVLRGRKVVLFPDLSATEDWKVRATGMCWDGLDISVYEELETASYVNEEDRKNGLDIADFILRVKFQENPELQYIPTETSSLKKADVLCVDNLLTKLSAPSQISSMPNFVFQGSENLEKYNTEPDQKKDEILERLGSDFDSFENL